MTYLRPRANDHKTYLDEIGAIVAELGDTPIDQIESAGVRWDCIDGIDPDDFNARICMGAGYYLLLDKTGTTWRDYGSCNRSISKEYEIAQGKREDLVAGLQTFIPELDRDGPIVEVVAGLTGTPPKWGNVLRLIDLTELA